MMEEKIESIDKGLFAPLPQEENQIKHQGRVKLIGLMPGED